jgi:hypothetical protein
MYNCKIFVNFEKLELYINPLKPSGNFTYHQV